MTSPNPMALEAKALEAATVALDSKVFIPHLNTPAMVREWAREAILAYLAALPPPAAGEGLEPVDLLTQFYAIRIGKAPLPISRDELGREVRTAWVRWAEQQASPKPHWLTPYDNLSEADKEADRQIGMWMANVVLDKFLELNPPSDTRTRLVATPAARAAVLEAATAIKRLMLAYVSLLETGRWRIIDLGGECDPVEVMEAGDPALIEARAALAALKEKT